LPETCEVYAVKQNDTCHNVAAKQRPYITITQLQAWNPNLNGLCTNTGQQVDMQICVGPPGGAIAASRNETAVAAAPTTSASVPLNVANGTTTRCVKYYNITAGDNCADITIHCRILPPLRLMLQHVRDARSQHAGAWRTRPVRSRARAHGEVLGPVCAAAHGKHGIADYNVGGQRHEVVHTQGFEQDVLELAAALQPAKIHSRALVGWEVETHLT